jgi:outer membrane protein assembly factor BamB
MVPVGEALIHPPRGRGRVPRPPSGTGFLLLFIALPLSCSRGEDWPRWRGPGGNAVSAEAPLPLRWSRTRNVAWKVAVPGEGASSPIVSGDSIFLTSSLEDGTRRILHCLDRQTGRTRWTRETKDPDPERTSALTGHAAATPATDGSRVVVLFGNAGAAGYDFEGGLLWRWQPGAFESELGLASSPVLHHGRAILLLDHDGDRFRTFDSFLIALDVKTGKPVWKTDRPGLGRSWSTPILVPTGLGPELVVSAQDELRAYDPETGGLLWQVRGMTGWVTPSPVFGGGLVFATSGKDGPTLAVRPGGRGDVTATHVAWRREKDGPYVCSPLLYGDLLYVHDEQGRLTCHEASGGRIVYRKRLEGKFIASAVAGDGKVYLTNDAGTTTVIRAGREFEILSENRLESECLASPALGRGAILIRTRNELFSISDGTGR